MHIFSFKIRNYVPTIVPYRIYVTNKGREISKLIFVFGWGKNMNQREKAILAALLAIFAGIKMLERLTMDKHQFMAML